MFLRVRIIYLESLGGNVNFLFYCGGNWGFGGKWVLIEVL